MALRRISMWVLFAVSIGLAGCSGEGEPQAADATQQSVETRDEDTAIAEPVATPSPSVSADSEPTTAPEIVFEAVDHDFLSSARDFDVDFDGRLGDDDGEVELTTMGREMCDVVEDIPQNERTLEHVTAVAADFGASHGLDELESTFLFGAAGGTYCDGYGWTLLVE